MAARKTQLIPDRDQEDRILGHCERVDREEPLHAADDLRKKQADRRASINMPRCGCGRLLAEGKNYCWSCTRSRVAWAAEKKRQDDLADWIRRDRKSEEREGCVSGTV